MCDVFIIGAESLLNFSEMQLNDKFLFWNQKKLWQTYGQREN